MRGNLAAAGRGVHSYQAIARLKPGVALQQAQSEMDAIASRLEEECPGTNKGCRHPARFASKGVGGR